MKEPRSEYAANQALQPKPVPSWARPSPNLRKPHHASPPPPNRRGAP